MNRYAYRYAGGSLVGFGVKGQFAQSEALLSGLRYSGFVIGETEVTQAQWSGVFPANPSRFTRCGPTCPVEGVSWSEAAHFANRLSDRAGLERCYELHGCTGQPGYPPMNDGGLLDSWSSFSCESVRFLGRACPGYRLPTDSEWEVAARAGSDGRLYRSAQARSVPLDLREAARYAANSDVDYEGGVDCSTWDPDSRASSLRRCGTHPVGQLVANAWNLYDVLGNVWEWVESEPPALRGGSLSNSREHCHLAIRATVRSATERNLNYGFRLARTVW